MPDNTVGARASDQFPRTRHGVISGGMPRFHDRQDYASRIAHPSTAVQSHRRRSMASSSSPKPQNVPAIKLGTRLRRLREGARFPTQAVLGTRLNISNDYVSKVETGKLVPAKDVLLSWLDACGATEETGDYLTELWGLACEARGGIADFILRWFENEAKSDFLRLWGLL